MNLYLHLSSLISKEMSDNFQELMGMILNNIDDKQGLKQARSEFQKKLENSTLHIRIFGKSRKISKIVQTNLDDIRHKIFFSNKKILIVKIQDEKEVNRAFFQLKEGLPKEFPDSEFHMGLIKPNLTNEVDVIEKADIEEMANVRINHLKSLVNVGFFSLMA